MTSFSKAKSPLSDEQLIAACRAGDEEAWQTLVQRYSRLVYTVPRRYGLTSAEVEDVYQSVWMNLLQNLTQLRQPERVSAWLVTTARRLCWEQRRHASYTRTDTVPSDEIPADSWVEAMTTEEIVSRYQQHETLRQAFARLGDFCRQLLQLLYYAINRPTYSQIAAELNLPIGSIGPMRARCLEKLRELMTE